MEASARMRFNCLLNEISRGLSAQNLEALKFLCKDEIGRRKLETIDSGTKLFQQLEELNLLSPQHTDTLATLLAEAQRPDLQLKLTDFQTHSLQLPVSEVGAQPGLDNAFDVICNEIGRDWRMLARKLGHNEALLQQIEYKHPRNLREQIHEALKEWQITKGKEATVDALIATLRSCKFNLVADSLTEKIYKAG
ncbi:protein FADD [Scyliorhinus canicula]|uniref:protein FADD n=1 Tax=Scyliorhinus canicula TaxID=7830 RepID=UPI0018F71AC5|nr:protein FADD [Scyliorhinus canicula]